MENKPFQSLKRQSDFSSLKQNGKFIRASDWLVVNYSRNRDGLLRPGWTVSKKVGKAVTRNRLKRWGREFTRKLESNGIDFNLIFKAKNKEFYRSLSHEEFDEVLRRTFKTIEQRL